MFSLWFNRSANSSYAEITYGSANDDRCEKWSYAPLSFGSYTLRGYDGGAINHLIISPGP